MFQNLKNRTSAIIDNATGAVVGFVGTGLTLASSVSMAAIDPAVTAGVTTLEADAATLGGIAMGAVVTIMLIVLGIRLVKKLLGRAV